MRRFLLTGGRAATLLLRPISSSSAAVSLPTTTTFTSNLLRLLSLSHTNLLTYRPPHPPPPSSSSFTIHPFPGRNSIRLTSTHPPNQTITLVATMVDGFSPTTTTTPRPHITLLVEISNPSPSTTTLVFACSAWPDCLEIQHVFPVVNGANQQKINSPYMGRDLRKMDVEMQDAVYGYLEERGVDDRLAGFLHEYVENKDKAEMIRWMATVEEYVRK